MRKTIVKIVSIIIVITLAMLSCVIPACSYETYFYNSFSNYENISLVRNDEQIFLIGTSDDSVLLEAVYPDEYSISLSLEQDIHLYTLCSDILILVSFLDDNSNTKITLYDITKDSFDSFIVSSDSKYMLSHFAYADGCVYIATPDGNISCYSKFGKHYTDFSLNTKISSLTTDFDGNVYAMTSRGIYSITKGGYTKINNASLYTRVCFIDNDIFADETGNFYSLNNSSKLLSFTNDSIYPCGGVYSDYFITFDDNKIYAVNRNTGQKALYCSLSNDILMLYSIGNEIVALTYNNGPTKLSFIGFDELKKLPSKNTKPNNNNTNDAVTFSIASSVYDVDFENMKITHIPHGTTVAQFKKNMEYDGYKVEFYRYEKDTPLKSGNVGTATQAIFYNDYEKYVFELSVIGDLTGEGNVNTRDKRNIFGQVVGRIQMTGVFLDSADLDESNEIDVIDIVLLLRMIKAQEND